MGLGEILVTLFCCRNTCYSQIRTCTALIRKHLSSPRWESAQACTNGHHAESKRLATLGPRGASSSKPSLKAQGLCRQAVADFQRHRWWMTPVNCLPDTRTPSHKCTHRGCGSTHETYMLQTVIGSEQGKWTHGPTFPQVAICSWSLLPQGMHRLLTGAACPGVSQLTQTRLQVLVFEGRAHKGFFCSFLSSCLSVYLKKKKKRIWTWVAGTLENLKVVVKRENLIKL